MNKISNEFICAWGTLILANIWLASESKIAFIGVIFLILSIACMNAHIKRN